MSDYRSVLEHDLRRAGPAGFSLGDLERRRRRRAQRVAAVAVALALTAVGIAGTVGAIRAWGPEGSAPVGPPGDPFMGSWESVDLDGSSQQMTIRGSEDGTYQVEVNDDSSTACGGDPATVSGTGTRVAETRMTITQEYRCRDGTVLTEVEGIRLDEWSLVHDPATDTLTDPTGVVWRREGAQEALPVPEEATTRTVETALGTWTWTWVPESEGAFRLWEQAEERWHDEDSAGALELSPRLEEKYPEKYREWEGWHGVVRVPWARSGPITVFALGEDWNLLVDVGDGYRLVDAPWQELPLFAFDVAVGPEGFVAAGLVAEGAEGPESFVDTGPTALHRWGSADGLQWRELGPPLPLGEVAWSWAQMVGDDDRLLMTLDDSLWTSTDGVDWQRVEGLPPRGILEGGPPARTSYGWVLTTARQLHETADLWQCEVWISPDAISWERVPSLLRNTEGCRALDDEVYVRVTGVPTADADEEEAPGVDDPSELVTDPPPPGVEPPALGLWIGRLAG